MRQASLFAKLLGMTKVCRQREHGEDSTSGLQHVAAQEMARRITAKARSNGVEHLLPDRIFSALGITCLSEAELHQLASVECMLNTLCIYASPEPR